MSMRRVSSRQRLVSWDAFDAEAIHYQHHNNDSDSETYETCGMELSTSSTTLNTVDSFDHPLKRKRGTKSKKHQPLLTQQNHNIAPELHVIPREVDNTSLFSSSNALLPEEIQLNILQFLDMKDLRSVMEVNHTQRTLLTTNLSSYEAIWKPICQRKWTWLNTTDNKNYNEDYNIVDLFRVNNYSVLLAMAAKVTPTKIDASAFTTVRRSRRLMMNNHNRISLISPPVSHLKVLNDGSVQFDGAVGIGDRCIRSDFPLPRPEPSKHYSDSLFSRFKNPILCRISQNQIPWKPFVAPYIEKNDDDDNNNNTVQLTPRLISYYEVTILNASTEEHFPRPPPSLIQRQQQPFRSVVSECVAVGLATEHFHFHTRMPGWDGESFGYHGDDGGIFHSTGSMIKQFGHKFGVGDTIGCGVDYVQQSIFYTRNGEFIGYAFQLKDHHLHVDLYPVIGLDTNCPVRCNFGTTRPFLFDLTTMIRAQEEHVVRAMKR